MGHQDLPMTKLARAELMLVSKFGHTMTRAGHKEDFPPITQQHSGILNGVERD
jgi:hypothetical protein